MKKRVLIFFLAIGITAVSSVSMAAMSNSRIRKETRFLTDKMAYELNLSTGQYNDVYEINYDFVYSIRYLMDDVMRGEEWALDKYYRTLDIRNDDLRWVLTASQYRRFIGVDYFYRPIYANGGGWSFRVYIRYTNHNHFYFGKPYHYSSYCGGHYRTHYHNSYYRGRYRHDFYSGSHSIRDHRNYNTHRRSDFGTVTIRPNSARRDDVRRNDVRRNDVRRESSASRDKNRVTPRSSATPNRVTPERTDSRRSSSRSQERVKSNNGTRSSVSERSSSSRRSSGNSASGSSRSSSSRSSERGSRDK
ncbi:putative exported protein [Bacteroides fragilis CAG:558]|nr:putative exported protein [Bacteroides fragilis CAG:558]